MSRVPGFNLWLFLGSESTQAEFRGAAVQADRWYVGGAQGSQIESGPHQSERQALCDAEAMTNTAGT